MLPRKTDQARTALQAHRAPLDMRQRRLLILCDGQRDLATLTALVGPDAPAMLIQLVRAGYLVTGGEAVEATAAIPPSTTSTTIAKAVSGTQPLSGGADGNAGSERRRSMAGARLYLLGILEMQRHPRAAVLLHDLQKARSDSAVVAAMQAALQTLPTLTSAGYTARVQQRLLEVLPREHQQAMQDTLSHHAEEAV